MSSLYLVNSLSHKGILTCSCVQFYFPLFLWVTLPCVSHFLIYATPNGGKKSKMSCIVRVKYWMLWLWSCTGTFISEIFSCSFLCRLLLFSNFERVSCEDYHRLSNPMRSAIISVRWRNPLIFCTYCYLCFIE